MGTATATRGVKEVKFMSAWTTPEVRPAEFSAMMVEPNCHCECHGGAGAGSGI